MNIETIESLSPLRMGDIVQVRIQKNTWRDAVIKSVNVPHDRPAYITVQFKGLRTSRDIETSERGSGFVKVDE